MAQLTHDQCRLLRDDALVERFNKLGEILADANATLPQFDKREGVAQIRNDLAKLAERMTRKRFAIGFIGPSQAGKSTTVGNLLSVSKDECPAPQGAGGPTTSVPTRLIPFPEPSPRCKPGERHAIRLRFMTKEEFRGRVADICALIGVQPDDNLRRLADSVATQHAQQPHHKAADHRVLLGLLEAARLFPQVLQDAPLYEDGEYGRRRDYATHQDNPGRYTLLREVQIEFTTDAMSPEIEMIDLPGLGVDKESDDRLTINFLPQLDGAFMFQLSSQVKGAEISRLAADLRKQHHSTLGGRVWMVVTRCDDLNDLQLKGPPEDASQPSMFCHLDETLGNQGLARDAVIFVGNAYHVALMEARAAGATGVPAEVRVRFPKVLQFTSADEPLVPERCARYPGQVEPWRRFVFDAGLGHLRETMQTRVAESVRSQTRRVVADGLAAAINRLLAELQVAEQQCGMSVEQMRQAIAWSGKLATLSASVGRDAKFVHPVVESVVCDLVRRLEDWGTPSIAKLAEVHTALARTLARSGADEARKVTEHVVAEVAGELEATAVATPMPEAAGLPTPIDFWSGTAENYILAGQTSDRPDADGRRSPPREFRRETFGGIEQDPSPFDAANGTVLTVADYLLIMRRKLDRVAHIYGTRLVTEIQTHIDWLADRYRRIGNEVDRTDSADKDKYREFCDRLAALL
jgi:hypothetical protein